VAARNSVRGVVTSAGARIAGARVTLFTQSLERFYETRTTEDGRYAISGFPNGRYLIGVAAPGFDYREARIKKPRGARVRDFALDRESQRGRWDIIGDTLPEVLDATDIAVLTADGRIFYCHDTEDPVLFDPVTGQKSFPKGSNLPSGCMNGTLLDDGGIFFAGGQDGDNPASFRQAVPWVRKYSFRSDSWTRLPDLALTEGRWYPGFARLADGSFLIMGGGTRPAATRTASCERFDPATERWRMTGSMLDACEFPPSALLYTGEVLATWSRPQLYDPATERWRPTGAFKQPERGWPNHSDHSLVVLADGTALAIGIRTGPADNSVMAEIYDPQLQSWRLTSNPGLVRLQSEVIALPDGKILVAGGETEQQPSPVPDVLGIVTWCDLYDPSLDAWRRVADMNEFREYHAVTLLVPDGRVLTTGGTRIKFTVGPTSSNVEAFTPPNLLRGVRPQITEISSSALTRGGEVRLTIAPSTRLTSVVLIGTGSTTHWVDGGIPRRIVLPVSQDGDEATVRLPENLSVLPLGFYMLFAMVDDIPSIARIVRVGES